MFGDTVAVTLTSSDVACVIVVPSVVPLVVVGATISLKRFGLSILKINIQIFWTKNFGSYCRKIFDIY